MTVAPDSTVMDVAVPTGPDAIEPREPGAGRVAISAVGLSKQYRIGARQNKRTLREAIMENVFSPWKRLRNWSRPGTARQRCGRFATSILRVDPGEDDRDDRSQRCRQDHPATAHGRRQPSRLPVSSPSVGRVAPLLEVGPGFIPELTGSREHLPQRRHSGYESARKSTANSTKSSPSPTVRVHRYPGQALQLGHACAAGFAVAAHLEPES